MKTEFEYVLSLGDKLGDYVEEWIAVVDNKIVAKGSEAKQVFDAAKSTYPNKTPFLMRVPSDKVMVL